jgi:hypothetical protein
MSDTEQYITGNGSAVVMPQPKKKPSPRHDRFLRIAVGRMQRALEALEQIAKLNVNKNDYSEHEVAQIVLALRNQVNEVEKRLSRDKTQKKQMFAFDSGQ